MWNPFKKKMPAPAPEPIAWRVPDKHADKICRLFDEMDACNEKKLPVFKFWKFARSIMPEEYKERTAKIVFKAHVPHFEITPLSK